MTRPYRLCARCIMDTTDPEIEFDDRGICNHCERAERLLATRMPAYKTGGYRVERIVERIKAAGKGAPYDCIVGVSGGVDSTYVAYTVRQLGLRALAVHFDNGWDSELAVQNIEQVLRRLDIELYTHVVDWEEFRDLQLSFLRASVPDAEIPTDHAIWALLYRMAAKFGVRYIISGTNLNTESILPRSWTYYVTDWTYIQDIHRRYGHLQLGTYPHASLSRFMYWVLGRRIRTVSLLNSIDYDKRAAMATLERELGYRRYGDKHHESIYTRFFQSYILPVKFGVDKRRAHFSSLIMSRQMTRDDALRCIAEPIASPQLIKEDLEYVTKKLGLTPQEFDRLMDAPPRTYADFKNEARRYERLKALMKVAQRRKLLPSQIGM
jgi:N-acetyl sugar amidotransferase